MRIIKPIADRPGKAMPTCPQWLDGLRKSDHRYSELACGCIIERLPKCITRIAGNHPEIECESHGFQKVKRDIPIREMIARQTNIAIDDKLIPPF